jgi:hypothetical protein
MLLRGRGNRLTIPLGRLALACAYPSWWWAVIPAVYVVYVVAVLLALWWRRPPRAQPSLKDEIERMRKENAELRRKR